MQNLQISLLTFQLNFFLKEKGIGEIAERRSCQNRSGFADGISNGIPPLRQKMGIPKETISTWFVDLRFLINKLKKIKGKKKIKRFSF
jgi:hypothetical protein